MSSGRIIIFRTDVIKTWTYFLFVLSGTGSYCLISPNQSLLHCTELNTLNTGFWFACYTNCVSVRGMSSHCQVSRYFPSLYFQGLVLSVLFYFVGNSIQEGRGVSPWWVISMAIVSTDRTGRCVREAVWWGVKVNIWGCSVPYGVSSEWQYLGASCSNNTCTGYEGRHFKSRWRAHAYLLRHCNN